MGDSALKLIGYVSYSNPTMEEEFKGGFTVSGDGSKKCDLLIEELKTEDSGVYYCAASQHSDSVPFSPVQKPPLIIQHMNTH